MKIFDDLMSLGLKKREINIYLHLLQNQYLTVKEIADRLYVVPQAVYRPLKNLEKLGLVFKSKLDQVVFSAANPNLGLDNLFRLKSNELKKSKNEALLRLSGLNKPNKISDIRVILGKEKMLERYVQLAKQAEREILVISIGEKVGEEILLANRDATDRGVKIMLIFQKFNQDNQSLLKSYAKMGWAVGHYPSEGYHLVVVDTQNVLLAVNNPSLTDERTTIEFNSFGLATAFREYFFTIWQKSKVILG